MIDREKIELTTLVPHGQGLALPLDARILSALKIEAGTPLEVSTDGKTIFIAPVEAERHERFNAAAADTFAKYPNMLKRLAE